MCSNLLSSFLSCSKRDMLEEEKTFSAPVKFFPLSTFLFVFLLAALRKPAGLHNLLLALSQPRSQPAASKTATPRPSVMAAGRGGTTWPPLSVVHTLLSDRRCAAGCSPGWSCWWAAWQRAPGRSKELDWVYVKGGRVGRIEFSCRVNCVMNSNCEIRLAAESFNISCALWQGKRGLWQGHLAVWEKRRHFLSTWEMCIFVWDRWQCWRSSTCQRAKSHWQRNLELFCVSVHFLIGLIHRETIFK